MEISIRKADWRDFGTLLRLQRNIVRESEHLAPTTGERKEAVWLAFAKTLLQRERTHTFIAFGEKEAIGYITVVFGKFKKVGATAYLVIGVRATHRGKGVGTALLAEAEAFVRSRGMHRLELEVFEGNEGAIRLYERLGFQIEGRRREAVKTAKGYSDIIWMGKLIS